MAKPVLWRENKSTGKPAYASRYQRLNVVEMPLSGERVRDTATGFAKAKAYRKDAFGVKVCDIPPEALFHGKIKGNDSGKSKRKAFYDAQRCNGGHLGDVPAKRTKKARKAKVSPKVVIIRESEFLVQMSQNGAHVEFKLFAKGAEMAHKAAREMFQGYTVEVIKEA